MGFDRKVEEISTRKIREMPDAGPRSIPVDVTSVSEKKSANKSKNKITNKSTNKSKSQK